MASSMRLLAETEHALASEIDKGLKNKWVWAWKDEIITTEVKGRKLSIRLGDSVQKLNVRGRHNARGVIKYWATNREARAC